MTSTDWRTLPAGRELDALVAERVMGLKRLADVKGLPVFEGSGGSWILTNALVQAGSFAMQYDPPPTLPRYSTDIAEASKVIDAVSAAGMHWWLSGPHGNGREWWAGVRANEDSETVASASERSLTEAICRAALAWAEAREKTR